MILNVMLTDHHHIYVETRPSSENMGVVYCYKISPDIYWSYPVQI